MKMCSWISVEERLPEDTQMCIVYVPGKGNPFIARYVGGCQFHDFFKNWVEVKCWMPFPEPPVNNSFPCNPEQG